MKKNLIFIIITCFLSLKLYADNRDFVDMGVRADNGDVLYWSTGDMILLKNGKAKIANYGGFGSSFGWGDVTGKAVGEDLINYGGSNPLYEISGNRNYDIARAKLGQPYRLPTYTEIERLLKNCSQEFVKISRNIKGVDENGVPIWLQGQWMWQHVIHTQRGSFGGWLSIKIDGLLVNVLSSEGKTLFEGLYDYSHGILKFSDFTLYLDMDKESIRDDKGEYLKKVSSQSTLTEICGYMLTSKINGNKLFFPAPPSYSTMNAGNGVLITNNNQDLSYWSGTLYKEDLRNAVSLVFVSNGCKIVAQRRYSHFRIRTVMGGSDFANSLQSLPMIVDKSNSEVSFDDKGVSNDVILPKTNNKGEYMVKSATWKMYDECGSFKMDLEYDSSNQLTKITKKYVYNNNKVTDIYTLKNNNGKYLKFVRYKNGKQSFTSICKYEFNKNGLISYINWYTPSQNKLVQTFQMFYNDNRELIKIIETTSENMDKDWYSKWVTTINWEDGNIISDSVNYGKDYFPDTLKFAYYTESEVANNTNLNINFLIFYSYGRDYLSDVVFGTEWCGKNTNLILKSDEDDLRGVKEIKRGSCKYYEYEKEGDLITKLRYSSPMVGKEHDYIYGTLTLEYLY